MNEIQIIIDHLDDPSWLAHHYGALFYFITFCWTAVEGETFVIFAGFLAHKGYLNIVVLVMAAWFGSFMGDQVAFFLGRRWGTRILHHFPKLEPGVERATGWLERYAVAFILSYRFIYGVRNVSGIAVGLSHIPWKRFAALNLLAAFIWALVFAGFGYMWVPAIKWIGTFYTLPGSDFLSHVHNKKELIEDNVRSIMLTMLALFAIIVILRLILMQFSKKKKTQP